MIDEIIFKRAKKGDVIANAVEIEEDSALILEVKILTALDYFSAVLVDYNFNYSPRTSLIDSKHVLTANCISSGSIVRGGLKYSISPIGLKRSPFSKAFL